MEENNKNIKIIEAQWKAARNGIIFFSALHFLFLIVGNNKMTIVSVGVNYGLSAWYIWRQVKRGKITKDFELKGFLVSIIVFLIRFTIGLLNYH